MNWDILRAVRTTDSTSLMLCEAADVVDTEPIVEREFALRRKQLKRVIQVVEEI